MREYLSERLCQQSGIPPEGFIWKWGADANEITSFLSKEYIITKGILNLEF